MNKFKSLKNLLKFENINLHFYGSIQINYTEHELMLLN